MTFNLKENLRGNRFYSEDNIDEDVKYYFLSFPGNGWHSEFCLWKIRLQKYIDDEGDYFEHFYLVPISCIWKISE